MSALDCLFFYFEESREAVLYFSFGTLCVADGVDGGGVKSETCKS